MNFQIISLSVYVSILMFVVSCYYQRIDKDELCNYSSCYWDSYPTDTLYYNNKMIIETSSYKFCINDSVSYYFYSDYDSIRINTCPPLTEYWSITDKNKLIVGKDTFTVNNFIKDTIYAERMLFGDRIRFKLIRNTKEQKEEFVDCPDIIEM